MAMICIGMALAYLAAFLTAGLLDRFRFPVPASAERVGGLDGLRGVLALSVMMHHFVIWMQASRLGGRWEKPTILFLENLGGGSVALFFMVTGFLFHARTLDGFSVPGLAALWIGRAFRLTPLIVASVATICLVIVATGDYSIRPETVFAPLLAWVTAAGQPPLLGHADSGRIDAYVMWSLKYEWAYYLLGLPLLTLVQAAVRGASPSWAPPLALVVAAFLLGRVARLDVFAIAPLFAIGMLAKEVSERDGARRIFASRGGVALAVAGLALAFACAPEPRGTPWDVLLGLFFASVVCGNDLFGLLTRRELLALGACSYGIYLFHGIVLFVLFFFGAPALAAFDAASLPLLLPVVAIVVVALAASAHVAIERPWIAIGRKVAARTATLALWEPATNSPGRAFRYIVPRASRSVPRGREGGSGPK